MNLSIIKSIIDERFYYEGELTPKTRIIEDLGADSLDIPQLLDEVEEKFNVIVSDEDLIHIRTIGDILTIIEKNKEE